MALQFASTNLVIELGIILALMLGWQFTVGEFVGGPVMIVVLAIAFRLFLSERLVDEARTHADRSARGRMEGHAEMEAPFNGNRLAPNSCAIASSSPPRVAWSRLC
jgi:uncharacterized protein